MATTYEDLKKANETIKPTDIKGKNYAEVNQRIKAFRMVFPEGYIITQIISNVAGVCVFVAEVGFYENGEKRTLGTGTAYEREDDGYINKNSYIENCETSAVGRALGMAGFGIDTSICSAEELKIALAKQEKADTEQEKTDTKQERKASPKQVEFLLGKYKGENLEKLLKANNLEKIEDMTMSMASNLISKLKGDK
jgi:hypothetical protein